MERKRKIMETSGKLPPRNGIHGYSYQINLSIIMLLRAYKLHEENESITFKITVEDRDGGKFDDLIYRGFVSGKSKEVIYLQAKHVSGTQDVLEPAVKRVNKSLSMKQLLEEKRGPYDLSKYFISFIENSNQAQNGDETHKYVLCTNAGLEPEIKPFLEKLDNTDVLSFAEDIRAVSYKISLSHPAPELEAVLINSSIDSLGKLFADYLKAGESINNEPVLSEIFSDLINQSFEILDEHNNDANVSRCKFTTQFCTANNSSDLNKFKRAIKKYYNKFGDYDLQNEEFLIANCLIKPQQKPGTDITSKITQFCNSFVLVVDSLNEEQLHEIAKNLVPSGVDVEPALGRFKNIIFDAMKNPSSVPVSMDPKFVRNVVEELKYHKHFHIQMSFSNEYLTELRMKYPYIIIQPDCLKSCDHLKSLNEFINDKHYGLHNFSSHYDADMGALIVQQMLNLAQCDCLFIDSEKFEQNVEMYDTIKLLLSRHKCVQKHKVLTAVGKLQNIICGMLRNLAKEFHWKIITVEQRSESLNDQLMERCLKVSDLTLEAQDNMRKHYKELKIFSTHVSFDTIVYKNDDLTFLLLLLKEVEKSENLNKQNFEKIREWYIHRNFEAYQEREECQETMCNSSKVIETLKKNYFNKNATFEELNNLQEFKTLDKDDSPFASITRTEASDPPGIEDQTKVNILINDAGFGKTAYFTWLAWRLAEQQQSLYVVKLNALEYSTDFERLDQHIIQRYDDTEVIRLLYRFVYLALHVSCVNHQTVAETDIIRREGDQCAQLLSISNGQLILDDDPSNSAGVTATKLIGLRLFWDKLNQKQFVLLLDGFDEVAAYYKDAVLACLKRFSDLPQLKCIYISSRPYDFVEDFRQTFINFRMYRLKPFSRNDQIVCLDKFLIHEFKAEYELCEVDHRHLVLRILYAILDNILDDVKTIPLLLGMAFGKILPAIKQHVDFQSRTLCGTIYKHEKLDTLQLVESFVERKLAIANTVKAGSTDSAAKTGGAKHNNKLVNESTQEVHAVLAIYFMFASGCRDTLLSNNEKEIAKQYLDNITEINTGLINGVRDNIPLFVHRLFAEYLAACWLHTHEQRLRKETFFRSKSFWAYGLKRMRTFFDQMIIRKNGGSDLHMAVLNDSSEQVLTLLSNNPVLASHKDEDDRTPLHLAVRKLCNNSEIRDEILKNMSLTDINEQDTLFGWSALDYAFVTGNDNAIRELLLLGAYFNLEAFIEQLCSNKLIVVMKLTYHYCELIKQFQNLQAVVKTIYKRVVLHLIKDRYLNIYASQNKLGANTVLEYCTRFKMYEMFRQLVEQSGHPTEVLADVADSLMQIAFEVQSHEITNYLIDDCGFRIPWIKCSRSLVYALKAFISLSYETSFKKILTQLCIQRNIQCANDEDIELPVINDHNAPKLASAVQPKVCCVQDNKNVELPLQEYDGYDFVNDAYVFELLITRAVHEGNLQLTSYIVQKKNMNITNNLIVAIMRLLPKIRGVRHERSIPCFNYLLNLLGRNNFEITDHMGRNLLHMAAQNGCFYMVHCLITKGFDRTKINQENSWNAFHYVAGSISERNDRPVKTLRYLMYRQDNNLFHIVDNNGYRLLELAVLNYHFKLSKMIFEEMFGAESTEQQATELLKSFERIDHQDDFKPKKQFLKFVSHDQGLVWDKIYRIIVNSIPVL